MDRMEFVAAVAEHAAPSCPRVGTREVWRSRRSRQSGGWPNSNRSSPPSSSIPRHWLPCLRRWSTSRSRLSACQVFRRRRFVAGSWRRWSNGRSPAPAINHSFSSLRTCSGSIRRRSISSMRSAIAARRRPFSFWRRPGWNSGRPGARSRTIESFRWCRSMKRRFNA